MTRSSPSSQKERPSRLRYDPRDEAARYRFRPGADWALASEYPQIKAVAEFTSADYFRLAWELLRRMPRYRDQHEKLQRLGFSKPTFFLGEYGSFFSDDRLPSFNRWQEVQLWAHKCFPRPSSKSQTFGEYVEARATDGLKWFVVHRRRWCLDYWGMNRLPDPDAPADSVELASLFVPLAAVFDPVTEPARMLGPRTVRGTVGPADFLVRLRLDAPLEPQLLVLQKEFESAQRTVAEQDAGNTLDPWGSMGRSSERADAEIAQRSTILGRSRVLLKQLELSSYWLRIWDLVQTERTRHPGVIDPELSRASVVARFEKDAAFLFSGTSATSPLADLVYKATTRANVEKWRARGRKYIEDSEEAFRQLVALGMAASR
jgi:hypothetical protein